MNREELERVLESVINIKSEIRSIELTIEELKSFTNDSNDTRFLKRIERKRARLLSARDDYVSQIAEIESILNDCFDKPSIESNILRFRYINGLSWKEIEVQLNYGRRQLTNYKNRAIDHILFVINGDDKNA